jgi:hypothetical protein
MNEFGIQIAKNPEFIAAAQTQAILALAAATALNRHDDREWLNVAGTKISG